MLLENSLDSLGVLEIINISKILLTLTRVGSPRVGGIQGPFSMVSFLLFSLAEKFSVFLGTPLTATNSTALALEFDSPLRPRDYTDAGLVVVLVGGLAFGAAEVMKGPLFLGFLRVLEVLGFLGFLRVSEVLMVVCVFLIFGIFGIFRGVGF